MPNNVSVENNFIGGLKTEFTGLNFPENACTAVSNCVFSIIGDVTRREGFDFEANGTQTTGQNPSIAAINTYRWKNAGGDGASEILVVASGGLLNFYLSSNSTSGSPVSTQLLGATIQMGLFLPQFSPFFNTWSFFEPQFSDGNGFLFVFHPFLDPFYVQFTPLSGGGPAVIANRITVQIRDFFGIQPEPGMPALTLRPTTLTIEHQYNLLNQGWTNNNTWSTSATTVPGANYNITILSANGGGATATIQSSTFTVASGLTITNGTPVNLSWSVPVTYTAAGDGNYNTVLTGTAVGTVTSYSTTTLVVNVTSSTTQSLGSGSSGIVSNGNATWGISASNLINTINTWHTAIGNYPSNADIWWEFRDTSNNFNPTTTVPQVPLSTAQAPQGHFVLNAFNPTRDLTSGVSGLTNPITYHRPKSGCWFQGRVWYAGTDDSFPATGDAAYYTWTENIYFSQIVSSTVDFGSCFQANDPTDDRLFALEPDDGGVIVIQGTGPIYKLFPIQNGLLVFAANGVWLIRGNSGLGFTANDFSINKISAVQSISGTSFVDVLGLPFFWNQEGIYRVAPTQNQAPYGFGGMEVEPLTVGTILSFYNNIPLDSKRFARGTYDPISYVLTWIYKSTEETGVTSRYQFDSALNLNVFNKAFYPYSISNISNSIFVAGINYLTYPTGSLSPSVKYLTVINGVNLTFSEERDSTNWVDWKSFNGTGMNYTSSLTTGFKVHGQGFRKFMPVYVTVYSRNTTPTAYGIQGVWDYAGSTATGRITSTQVINNPITNRIMANGITWPDTVDYNMVYRRHKIRGHGNVLQLQFSSVTGQPFDLMGWSIPEQINVGS